MSRVVLVTGAGGGLGSATSRLFAASGDRLVLTDIAEKRVKSLADDIVAAGGAAVAVGADARHREQVERVVEIGLSEFGRIDAVVNTAGGQSCAAHGAPRQAGVGARRRGVAPRRRRQPRRGVRVGARRGPADDRAEGGAHHPRRVGHRPAAWARHVRLRGGQGGRDRVHEGGGQGSRRPRRPGQRGEPGPHPHERLPVEAAGPNVVGYTADTMLGRLSTPEEFARFVTAVSHMTAISGQTINIDSKILF